MASITLGNHVYESQDGPQLQRVDQGRLEHTLTRRIDGIDAAGLIEAHALVEAGNMIGKVIVANH
ncbi:hypothetical protein [Burkholderia vietnamiensis]|uniref:hypothetical protein n=1 Tax=Burkholderia vietnamiensis TaxID=60552 RepID=UPI00084177A5|nr:hypothetical protein [Burkholderia vietnamiensis]AOJ14121.1 hypothetical protein WJ02_11350 [Burkholderia vietnamiensis]